MANELIAPWAFAEIDDTSVANTQEPDAAMFAGMTDNLNHLCGRHWRILFNQHVVNAMLPADPAGDINPLYQIRFNDTWPAHRRYHVHCLPLHRSTTTANDPRIRASDGSTVARFEAVTTEATITEAEHTGEISCDNNNNIGNAYQNIDIDSLGDLRPIAAAVIGRRWSGVDPMVLSTDVGAMTPMTFYNGKHITHTDLINMRDAIDRVWKDNRRIFAPWSAIGNTNTAGNIVAVTSATDVNLMDQTVTVRSASSPGCICPIRYCGRLNATQVEASVAVYAEGTGGTGTVSFQSSQNTISIGSITTKGWYFATVSTMLLGDTTLNEYDKVDIFGKVGGGGTLRVWAWNISEDPL